MTLKKIRRFPIRLRWVWGCIPTIIFRTNQLPKSIAGLCLTPVVLLNPWAFEDEPTIQHELAHVKQTWLGLGIGHFLLYWGSERYRLWAETSAFAVEIRCSPENEKSIRLESAAKALTAQYRLAIPESTAKQLLQRKLGS